MVVIILQTKVVFLSIPPLSAEAIPDEKPVLSPMLCKSIAAKQSPEPSNTGAFGTMSNF